MKAPLPQRLMAMADGNGFQFNQHLLSVEAEVEGPLREIFEDETVVRAYPCLKHAKTIRLCGFRVLEMHDTLVKYVRSGISGTIILRIRAEWWSDVGNEDLLRGTPYIDIEDIVQKVDDSTKVGDLCNTVDDKFQNELNGDANAEDIVIENADLKPSDCGEELVSSKFKFNDAGLVPWTETLAYPSVSRVFDLPQSERIFLLLPPLSLANAVGFVTKFPFSLHVQRSDTLEWSNADVRRWLAWLVNVYGAFDTSKLHVLEQFDGKQLCDLSRMQFERDIGADGRDYLWHHIKLFRHGLVIAITPEILDGTVRNLGDSYANKVPVSAATQSNNLHAPTPSSHVASPTKLTIRLSSRRDPTSKNAANGFIMPNKPAAGSIASGNNANRKPKKKKKNGVAGKNLKNVIRHHSNNRAMASLDIPFEYVEDDEAAHMPPVFPNITNHIIGTPLVSPPSYLLTQHLRTQQQQQGAAPLVATVTEGVSRRSQRSNTLSLTPSSNSSSNSSGAGGGGVGNRDEIDQTHDSLSSYRSNDDSTHNHNSTENLPVSLSMDLPVNETSWQYQTALFSRCMFGRHGPQTQVWEFLLGYLTFPPVAHLNAPLLSWLGDDGTFVLNDSEAAAAYYGQIIHKRDMSYERLSRKFRYHYTGDYPLLVKNSSSSKVRSFTYQFSAEIAAGIGFTLEELRDISKGKLTPPKRIPEIPPVQNPIMHAMSRNAPLNNYRQQLMQFKLDDADKSIPTAMKLPFEVIKVSTRTLSRALAQPMRTPTGSLKSASHAGGGVGKRNASLASSNLRSKKKKQLKKKKRLKCKSVLY